MKASIAVVLLVSMWLTGCLTTSIQGVTGHYSLDTSRLCSRANLVTIHLQADGTIIETGSSPGIVDEHGEPYSWMREGRWCVKGAIIVLKFEEEADQFFRVQWARGTRALVQLSTPDARADSTAVRYLKWKEEPEEETEPNQALQTTPMARSVYERTIEFGYPQRGV